MAINSLRIAATAAALSNCAFGASINIERRQEEFDVSSIPVNEFILPTIDADNLLAPIVTGRNPYQPDMAYTLVPAINGQIPGNPLSKPVSAEQQVKIDAVQAAWASVGASLQDFPMKVARPINVDNLAEFEPAADLQEVGPFTVQPDAPPLAALAQADGSGLSLMLTLGWSAAEVDGKANSAIAEHLAAALKSLAPKAKAYTEFQNARLENSFGEENFGVQWAKRNGLKELTTEMLDSDDFFINAKRPVGYTALPWGPQPEIPEVFELYDEAFTVEARSSLHTGLDFQFIENRNTVKTAIAALDAAWTHLTKDFVGLEGTFLQPVFTPDANRPLAESAQLDPLFDYWYNAVDDIDSVQATFDEAVRFTAPAPVQPPPSC